MAEKESKVCARCKQSLPVASFNRSQSDCRPCQSKRYREWRLNNAAHHAARNNRWYHAHKAIVSERMKVYRNDNVESVQARKRTYHKRNAEKIRAKVRAWAKANPHQRLVQTQKRRARKHSLPNDWTVSDVAFALAFWSDRCACCAADGPLHWDHWIPLIAPACPGTFPGNMLPLCLDCNSTKSGRPAAQWLQDRFTDKADEIARRVAGYFQSARQISHHESTA